MGKGDRKTAKGKRYTSSYGNSRPHSAVGAKPAGAPATPAVKKVAPATKAPAKKAAPAKKKAS